jgi:DNA-binding LacI/PurR family transcriptional regulator
MAQQTGGASLSRRQRPARILDVAELASVSVATVSRVLNGDPRVDHQLRDRVLAATSQLGYRPNRLARNLRRQQMDAIGMVVPDIENPHFARMVRVVEGIALGLGHRVLVCNTDEQGGQQAECLQMLADERVSGILLSPSDSNCSIDYLRDLGIPVVAIDRPLSGAADAVVAGNVSAINAATRRLIGTGQGSIGFVGGRSEIDPSSERQHGYLTAMEQAGLAPVLVAGGFRRHIAEAAVATLLRGKRPVSALVVANSPMALGAIRAIRRAGLRIPDDIAVIAVDDPPWAELLDPPLTVLAQRDRAMASRAVEFLVRRIGGDQSPPVRDVHPLKLIVRRSCGTAHLR